MPATTFADDLAVLTELSGSGNEWDGLKIHLATVAPPVTGSMPLAGFTEATFPGYAAITLVWGLPYYTITGDAEMDSALLAFLCTGTPTAGETIVAWYATDTAGTTLLFADNMPNPVTIGGPSQGIGFVIAMLRYLFSTIQMP
jgi:hypothetical protein